MPKVMFNMEKCKGCELCTAVCPKKIVVMSERFNNKGYRTATCSDDSLCLGCMLCAKACPDCVIEIFE